MENFSNKPLPIIESSYTMLLDLYQLLGQFPQSQKPVLGNKIATLGNQLVELLIETSMYEGDDKIKSLKQATIVLQKLMLFVRFGKDLAIIPFSKYEYFAVQIVTIGKQIGGWKKWQEQEIETLKKDKEEQDKKRGGVFYTLQSPIILQYIEAKSKFANKIIAIKVGAFCKLFFEDAKYFSEKYQFKLVNLGTLSSEIKIMSCGFPITAIAKYKQQEPLLEIIENLQDY